MKKIIIRIVALIVSYTFMADGLVAQATTTTIQQTPQTPQVLDEKTQKKVDKATLDLAKDKKSLAQAEENYQKGLANYDKKKRKGKLSPNDEVKEIKAKKKAEKEIAKRKKEIADNEAFLQQYKM